MFKILVPTDFSPAAHVAALYAVEIANQLNEVELNFFHCIETSNVSHNMVHKVDDILLKEAEIELQNFNNSLPKTKTGIHKFYDVVFGEVETEITNKIEAKEMDLIVMGTKGAGGLKKFFIGSNASKIANKSKFCPVLIVPEHTKINKVKKIVYATDLEGIKSEAPVVISFSKMLDAHLDILHITDKELEIQNLDPLKVSYELVLKNNYSAISFHQVWDLDVLTAIEKYALDNKADMVVLFRRSKGYFDEIFDQNYTKELAFHAKLPLLVIPFEILLQ